MHLSTAENITNEFIGIISTHCLRIEVVGSIRRRVSEVNDIDILIIQHPFKLAKFFLSDNCRDLKIVANGLNIKCGPKHRQIYFRGIKIELWIAEKENFGLIHLIRTGSAMFSASILHKWKEVSGGGYSDKGYLRTPKGVKIPTHEEMDVFKLCELDYIDPINRSFKNFIKL